MIKNNLTDAGRVADGFTDERLDCLVRAVACAFDIPYWQSHAIASHFGRKPKHKTYTTVEILRALNLSIVRTDPFSCRGLTQFVKTHSKGNFIVGSRGHAFALKDGVVFDQGPLSGHYQVKWYAQVFER